LQHALLGAGDTRRTALVSIGMQWVFFLPVAYLVGPVMGYGLLGIWLAQMVYRFVQAVLFMLMWRGQKWVHIKV
jgi:MATE family multidrug resistance protein